MNSYLHMNSHVRMGVLVLKLQHGHMIFTNMNSNVDMNSYVRTGILFHILI